MSNKKYKGLIFDMDGTLTKPFIDFGSVRNELGIDDNRDILEVINELDDYNRERCMSLIRKYEKQALEYLQFQPDVESTLDKLKSKGIKLGIITRNSKHNAQEVVERLKVKFWPVLTRNSDYIKPDPNAVHYILNKWQIKSEDAMLIGDFRDDIICGKRANIKTCFLENEGKKSYSNLADLSISSFKELNDLVLYEA